MLNKTRFITLFSVVVFAMVSWHATAAPLLNGVAVHTELGKEQFIAGLYSDSLSADRNQLLSADVDKRVQVRVLADTLPSRRFKRMWIEGIAINSTQADLQANSQRMADFSNMLRVKLIAGDILTIDRSMKNGLVVSLNGTTLGTIEDRRFFDLLLGTWIGAVPLSSGFRDNLLSNGDIAPALLERYDAVRPTDQRIASVERAIAASASEQQQSRATQRRDVAIDAPDLAKTPPTLALAPPVLTNPNAPPAPKPAAPQQSKPEPAAPKETQVAKASSPQPTRVEDDVLDDDDEEEFTAASLLSQQVYIGKLKNWAQKELKYPSRASSRGWEGNVRLDVTVDRKGSVIGIEVAEDARYSILTKEAVRAVKAAEPFPAMPPDVKGKEFLFTLPVAFKLQ